MRDFKNISRLVIKIGSSSLVNEDFSVNMPRLVKIMQSFKMLKEKGVQVALVSSGAIAVGMHELNLKKKPKDMALKQACAAVGQAKLMESYNKAAEIYGLKTGQVLLNHDDFQIRKRMNHLTDALEAMFKNGIIPIINENDALAVEEIKVGDNDTLAALIAPMVGARLLILFSDIDGLYNKNPKVYKDAKKIDVVEKIDQSILDMVGSVTTEVGTGGMQTKINAALISTMAGCQIIICNATEISSLVEIVEGQEIGTLFLAQKKGISSREHWMIFKTNATGSIIIDEGCKKALTNKKVSILPKGIKEVCGEFLKGSVVEVKDENNKVVAKGITNYSNNEILQLMGSNSKNIKSILGHDGKPEVIHANDLVVIKEDVYGCLIK